MSLERIGRGCIGMKGTQRKLPKIMQIMNLLRRMIKIFPHTGWAMICMKFSPLELMRFKELLACEIGD